MVRPEQWSIKSRWLYLPCGQHPWGFLQNKFSLSLRWIIWCFCQWIRKSLKMKASRRQGMIDFYFFSGGNYGGSEPTCYWWLNSHLKLGKQHGLSKQIADSSSAHNSYIGNPCAESTWTRWEALLESRHSNYSSGRERCVGCSQGEQRCSAGGSPLCQLTPGWRRLSWVFQVDY